MTALLSIALLASAAGAAAQEPDTPPPFAVTLTTEQARILEGIRANDWRAIIEAGRSRDRIYLEALAAALPRRDKPGEFVVQEALAQLGDTQQLQVIWCASINERDYHSMGIVFKLARVGGWFAIRGIDYLISPSGERHWLRALRYQEKNTDALQASPKLWAVQSLPKLVPQSPFPTLPGDEFVFAQKWREWIAEHREQLQLLQPTGEGVDFSPTACKDGKPRQQRQ